MANARAKVVFHGRVQGVYFRAHCKDAADRLGLRGYVRNLPNGSVEAVLEGERGLVEECIEWNARRQPYARVERMELSWEPSTGEYRAFDVRR